MGGPSQSEPTGDLIIDPSAIYCGITVERNAIWFFKPAGGGTQRRNESKVRARAALSVRSQTTHVLYLRSFLRTTG